MNEKALEHTETIQESIPISIENCLLYLLTRSEHVWLATSAQKI